LKNRFKGKGSAGFDAIGIRIFLSNLVYTGIVATKVLLIGFGVDEWV
jgi:hypothetical protein